MSSSESISHQFLLVASDEEESTDKYKAIEALKKSLLDQPVLPMFPDL